MLWIEQVISSVDGHFSAVASPNQRSLGDEVAAKPENASVSTMLLNNNGAERLMKARLRAAIAAPTQEETLLGVSGEGQSRRVPHVALFAAGVVIKAETEREALGAWACRRRTARSPTKPRRARRTDTCRGCLHPPRALAIGL